MTPTDPDNDNDDDAALGPNDVPNPDDPSTPAERNSPPDPRRGIGPLTAEKAEALTPKEVG